MIKHVIKDGDKFYVKPAKGFTPKNSVGIVPENIAVEDWPYLTGVQSNDPDTGQPVWSFSVDVAKKTAAQAAETKADQLKTLKTTYLTEVYEQLFEVFRTKESETATAEYETWKDMKAAPSRYSSLGLKTDHQVNAADGTELFSPGSALDTDQKITDFATRKIEQAEAYGAYRAQRKQQYKNEKEVIQNQ